MDLTIYDVAVVPLIVGLVGALKLAGLPSTWAPLASLVFGVAAGLLYLAPEDPAKGILLGVNAGLAASGLYSQGKTAVEAVRGPEPPSSRIEG